MTTVNHRTPTVLEGDFQETTRPVSPPPMPPPKLGEIAPGVQVRFTVHNPHRFGLLIANLTFVGACIGTVLAVARDDNRADLAFAMLLLSVALIGWQARRYNTFADNPPQSAFRQVF